MSDSKSPSTKTPSPKEFLHAVDELVDTDEGMTFPQAIEEVINGKRVTKAAWDDSNIYLELKGEYLIIHKEDSDHSIILRDGDLLGTDWMVV